MTATKRALLKIDMILAKPISSGEKKFPKTIIKVAADD
jgi:hypothetical protein